MHNLGTGSHDIDCFSIDFWEDKIFIAKKEYPAGYFATNILNFASQTNTDLLILAGYVHQAWGGIQQDGLGRDKFDSAKKNIGEMQEILFQREPFSLFDLEFEKRRFKVAFSNECFTEMTEHEETKSAFLNYLRYFFYIPSDICNFSNAIINLIDKYMSKLKKRDETNFAIACHDFFTNPLNLMLMEDAKPVPHFDGFEPQPVVRSIRVISEHPHDENRLTFVQRMYFGNLMNFFVTDFINGLHYEHSPKRCEICGRYFLMLDGRHQRYCNGIDPKDEKKRSCRKVAAEKGREAKEKSPHHPLKKICTTRLGTIATHKASGKISEKFAREAKKLAQELRDRAIKETDYAKGEYENDMTQEAIYSAVRKKLEGRM